MTQDLVAQLTAARQCLDRELSLSEPIAVQIAAWTAYGEAVLAELRTWQTSANEAQAGVRRIIEELTEIAGSN